MKRLFLDIETSHMVLAKFSLYPEYTAPANILKDWQLFTAAWKWEGKARIYGKLTYTEDDSEVVAALREAIVEADELVYHNGDKFDFKKLNTRVLYHQLPPMPKPRSCDTLKELKKHFSFSSNSLNYAGKFLGIGSKIHTKPGLWLEALEFKKSAIKEMLQYNKGDITLLEDLFHRLEPHINTLNPNLFFNDPELRCTNSSCNSTNLRPKGHRYTKVAKYRRYVCRNCGKWGQAPERVNKSTKVMR